MQLLKQISNDILFTIIGFALLIGAALFHPYLIAGSVASFVLGGYYALHIDDIPKDLPKSENS